MHPKNEFDHYLYLAKSILVKRVDIINFPYHDTVVVNNRTFLPFPPGPSLLIIPFLFINPNITQQEISIIVGSLNVALLFLLLNRFTNRKLSLIIAIFFAFGTVHFWASVIGTAWPFAQIIATFFFLLCLNLYFQKRYFLSGLFFTLAAFSRTPILFSLPFFVLSLRKNKVNLFKFLSTAFLVIPAQIYYNWLRFGDIFQAGYLEVYKKYIEGGYNYSLIRIWKPHLSHFNYLDIRNIPLHLYSFLIQPPDILINPTRIKPSPYGMGLAYTSPLLVIALKPKFKTIIERRLAVGAVSIMAVVFLHFSQGWIQFGYRFILDFLPFLLVILAIRLKLNKFSMILIIFSFMINFWGVLYDLRFGL